MDASEIILSSEFTQIQKDKRSILKLFVDLDFYLETWNNVCVCDITLETKL